MIAFAEREKRSLGNLDAILLEWSFEQLKAAGSTTKLLGQSAKRLNKDKNIPCFNFIKGHPHAHIRLGVNDVARGVKCLLMVDKLNLHGRAEWQWIHHIHITAMPTQLARPSGDSPLCLKLHNLGGSVKRIAGRPAIL
jgi:hypothetical protein